MIDVVLYINKHFDDQLDDLYRKKEYPSVDTMIERLATHYHCRLLDKDVEEIENEYERIFRV